MARVKETEYYDLLGVAPDANSSVIRKAYLLLAKENHPDRGGDEAKFKAIGEAYAVLSDEKKREMYDKYGKEGLREGGGPSMDPFSMFRHFGFGGFDGDEDRGPQRGKNIEHNVEVSLAELYTGKRKKMKVNRKILCDECDGSGRKDKDTSKDSKCAECRGNGVVLRRIQQGNTIYQTQANCSKCSGKGWAVPADERCSKCAGEKVMRDSKIFTLEIERGAKWGESITFYGEADQQPGIQRGDIVFYLKQKATPEDSTFTRVSSDLNISKDIPLVEALTGFKFVLTHLDGHQVCIANKPGEVVAPGDTLCVTGEGFSIKNRPEQFGDLNITFNVVFPTTVSEANAKTLRSIWTPTKVTVPAEVQTLQAAKITAQQQRAKQQQQQQHRQQEAYEEDQRRGGGGGGVECQQQ